MSAEVRKGLHSFIMECGRFTKTTGAHYTLVIEERPLSRVAVLRHHLNRWQAELTNYGRITIFSGNDQLEVVDGDMYLNGQRVHCLSVPGGGQFTAHDIRRMVTEAVKTALLAQALGLERADSVILSTG